MYLNEILAFVITITFNYMNELKCVPNKFLILLNILVKFFPKINSFLVLIFSFY
jgi:hypothetical protein